MKENLMAVLTNKAKNSTKGILALLVALPGLVQIPTVKAWISLHPKISTSIGTLVMIGTLLHNPKVQQVLGMDIPDGASVQVDQKTSVQVTEKKEN